jgi:putative PIN family toxin of toxin-antitoxin system
MLAVLDTNFWVSYLISHHPPIADVVDIHLAKGAFEAVTSLVLLEELAQVLRYPKFQHYYDAETGTRFLALVAALSEVVDLPETVPAICRHPADDWVIATAVAGNAGIIVSGNKHLLELERVGKTTILTPRQFLEYLIPGK